ncbi:MAG: cytochrome P450 [Myxococcota bacterium]
MDTPTELPLLRTDHASYWADPHDALRQARREGPVARTPHGMPVLLDYDDCANALADARLANDYDALLLRNGISDGPLWAWWKLAMLNNNPPTHTRLRSLVGRAFTPRAVARAAGLVRAHLETFLLEAFEAESTEVVHALCEPMPLAVMCELIGFPRSDVGDFDRWVVDLGLTFSEKMTPEIRGVAETAMTNLGAYVAEQAARRRRARDPGDDLFAVLVSTSAEGDRLSDAELVAMVVNLLLGALDTTRGALSMMLATLAGRPDLWRRLRERPELAAAAVEESLRTEPSVAEITRIAREDVTLAGIDVLAGAPVGISVLAANRDPRRFPDPDRFDLERSLRNGALPSLTFGRGIHHCVGSALARLELRTVLSLLLERCDALELAGPPPRYVPFLRVRCVDALRLALRPAEAGANARTPS